MQFLAHWARKLSWKEVAESFQTTWPKVFQSVEYIVAWGVEAQGFIRNHGYWN